MKRQKANDSSECKEETKDKAYESSLQLPLVAGKVTGLPTDLASAPKEIRLSQKIHELGNEALEKTKQSGGKEWGIFIHFNDTGQLIPGRLRGPSKEAAKAGVGWIALEEYLEIKTHDETIHGSLHTHPKSTTFPGGELTFSEGNLGTFLEVEDVLLICKGPQNDYLVAFRTQQTPLSYKGISRQAIAEYKQILPKKLANALDEGLTEKLATIKAVFEAMREICKKYNIAVYKGHLDNLVLQVENNV